MSISITLFFSDFFYFFQDSEYNRREHLLLISQMYQNLDDLSIQIEYEQQRKPKWSFKRFFKEIKILAVIFVIMFLWMYLVTNAQLLIDNVQDHIAPQQVASLQGEDMHSSAGLLTNSVQKMLEVEELVQKYQGVVSMEKELAPEMNQVLRESIDSYDFDFNLLPPTNRLIISSINLDVPLIYTQVKDYTEFNEGTFDSELENGVVKYPTTPNPGEGGNAFFFWHTSQEYRKNNKYGTVFRNIPKLKPGDIVQVVWEWVLYEYKVITTEIVTPKQVNDTYMKYSDLDKEYITLMGCYPIGRTDKRMMIFAERII